MSYCRKKKSEERSLTRVGVWGLAGDLDVGLQEALQGHVGREVLDAVVGDAVLRPALRTLHLQGMGCWLLCCHSCCSHMVALLTWLLYCIGC